MKLFKKECVCIKKFKFFPYYTLENANKEICKNKNGYPIKMHRKMLYQYAVEYGIISEKLAYDLVSDDTFDNIAYIILGAYCEENHLLLMKKEDLKALRKLR